MTDNVIRTTKTTFGKFHQEMKSIHQLANLPYLSVIQQMAHTQEPNHRQQLEITRTLEMAGAASRIQEIVDANQHWRDLIKQATATSCITECLSAAHQSWFDTIKPIQYDFSQLSQLQASAKLTLCNTALQLSATERLIAGIDFEAIRSRFQIEMPVITGLESSIAHVAASYGNFAKSLREISDITRLPAFVLRGATREIYTTSLALKTLHLRSELDEGEAKTEIQFVAEAKQETSGCINLLRQVDPDLTQPYIGAWDALYANNADRERHILSSLRELWSHLLRRLAPNDLVTAWIPSVPNQKDLLHDDKPTRRARILYVCRELNNDPLTDFLIQDTSALVKLVELFNRVHKLEKGLTYEQLRAILLRTDSWLMYILQISSGNFHK